MGSWLLHTWIIILWHHKLVYKQTDAHSNSRQHCFCEALGWFHLWKEIISKRNWNESSYHVFQRAIYHRYYTRIAKKQSGVWLLFPRKVHLPQAGYILWIFRDQKVNTVKRMTIIAGHLIPCKKKMLDVLFVCVLYLLGVSSFLKIYIFH